RVNGINAPNGYSLRVDDTGAWSVLQNSTALATGKLAAFGINQWHNLSLSFKGNSITAKIDNTTVAALTDTTYRSGYVGLAVTSYKCAQFDNFSIINNSTSTPTPTTSITSTTPTPTLTTSASPKPTQDSSGNLALGKLATSDSEESSKGNIASNANDGDNNTRWCTADSGLNHWLKIDLGAGYNLTGTEVMWERALKNYKYKIDVSSDNVNWTTSVDKTNNLSTDQTQRDSFTANNIRYVRITVTGLETDAWASIYEFRVYGKSGPAQLSPDVNHDGAVNMSDVIILAKVFNSINGDGRYVAAYDLNGDGAINMTDIILIAAKFNTLV
ncbi:MAG: discoidin domain-containing protein, partial [Bacillota bacterium]|nr:discoidin domain-containing protein [Bacillota bacterium]